MPDLKVPSLTQFYDELQKKGVRLDNQYKVVFNLSGSKFLSALNDRIGSAATTKDLIHIWAEDCALPGKSQEINDILIRGYPLGIPGKMASTNSMTMKLRCDAPMFLRTALIYWMDYYNNFNDLENGMGGEGSKTLPSKSCTIDVHLLSEGLDKVMQTYELIGVIPSSIGEITLSQTNANIVVFDAVFRYQYWRLKAGDSSIK